MQQQQKMGLEPVPFPVHAPCALASGALEVAARHIHTQEQIKRYKKKANKSKKKTITNLVSNDEEIIGGQSGSVPFVLQTRDPCTEKRYR